MSRLDDLARGLASFLAREWGEEVIVHDLQPVSAGARRENLLFDAHRGSQIHRLVATVIPRPAMQVLDVAVEAANLRLGRSAGMPVPEVHAVCQDPDFVGGPFFVTERIDGETIPRQVLKLVAATPGLGERLARQCGEALARLHAVDPRLAHPELARPAELDAAADALSRIELQLDELLQPSPALALGWRWLERNRPPAARGVAVLHGDFRNGNLIVGADGLRGALDWETSRLGDPMEDLAWLCVRMWRFRNDALEVGGFASRSELRSGYEGAGGGWDEDSFHWWKTLGTVRWGLGLAGQAAAHLSGAFPSIVMAASGRRVAELEYDTLMLLRRAYG